MRVIHWLGCSLPCGSRQDESSELVREALEYRLVIDGVDLGSMPMIQLAGYMTDLARLLGEPDRVHLARLETGSTVLVSRIEPEAEPQVRRRLSLIRSGDAPKEAMAAAAALDDRLTLDGTMGRLSGWDGAEIIAFPGHSRARPERYGPFRERGSLDGVVIRIGGKSDMVPVLLMDDGVEYHCQTTVGLSKQLASYYRGATVRVHGHGRWVRDQDASWTLLDFVIEAFDVLDDATLTQVVEHLRAIEGGEWSDKQAAMLRREEGLSS